MMFIIGTGKVFARVTADVAIERQLPEIRRRARRVAIETASSAFAPSFDLFGVPSSSISLRSIAS